MSTRPPVSLRLYYQGRSAFRYDLAFLTMLKERLHMIQFLLLCMMLFQSASPTATKPMIDNDRVTRPGRVGFHASAAD